MTTARPLVAIARVMADQISRASREQVTRLIAFIAAAAMVYLALPELLNERQVFKGHFAALAESLAEFRLDIEWSKDSTLRPGELIVVGTEGTGARVYCAYPPLPAVLMVPFVWLGASLSVETMCRLVSVINVLLFDRVLDRWPQRAGLGPLSGAARWLLLLTFAFGCATWPNALHAGDWHLAHAVALGAFLLALGEEGRRGRGWLVGVFIGLAMMARPTTGLAAVFFALSRVGTRDWRGLAAFAIGPVASVGLLALYNLARFGSPLDFGYDRMLLSGEGAALMQRLGQFHVAYVPRNFFWFFLAPPWMPLRNGQWLPGYDPRGLSLFIATPAFLYAVAAARHIRADAVVRHAIVGVGLCLLPLLMYFNTGFWQFGHRFSMDYLPLVFILMLAGMRPVVSRAAMTLMIAAVAIHAYGLLVDPVARIPILMIP